MKSLSLNRPLVIMMVGMPGAGKSFFARRFAETFNVPLVSIDRLRSILFAEPSYSRDENILLAQVASSEIGELIKTNKTMLVDGGLNARVDRQKLASAARKLGYDSLVIWVQTDEPTAQRRSLKRSASKEDDELNSPLSAEQFAAQLRQFTAPTAQEKYLVISGKHTYATQAKVVLRKLAGHRPAPASPTRSDRPTNSENHVSSPTRRRNLTIN